MTAWRTWLFPPLAGLLDELRQPGEFFRTQVRGGVAQVGCDGLLQRALEKVLQDPAKGRLARLAARPRRLVDVSQPFLAVFQVSLLFEDAQERADGGAAGRVGQAGVNLDGRGPAAP